MRLLLIGGGVLATLGVGTAVAMAVVSANGSDEASGRPSSLPATADLPSASATPSFAPTSAPPPLDPKEFVSSKAKDSAPNGPDIMFPGRQLTMGSAVYKKAAKADTTNCVTAVQGTLPKVLTDNNCTRLMRVTYVKDGVAVTVGVAVFDTEAQALKAKGQADKSSIVKALTGTDAKSFCSRRDLPLDDQLLRPLRLLHDHRLHGLQGRDDQGHPGLRRRGRPRGVHIPADPPPRRDPGIGGGEPVT